jgi:hypothetical protein
VIAQYVNCKGPHAYSGPLIITSGGRLKAWSKGGAMVKLQRGNPVDSNAIAGCL